MVRDVNINFLSPDARLPGRRKGRCGDVAEVNCATCHQGVYKPLYGASMLKDYPELTASRRIRRRPLRPPRRPTPNSGASREVRTAAPAVRRIRALAMPPLRVARSRHARSEPARALPCRGRGLAVAVSAAAPMSHAILIVVMLFINIIAAVGIAASRG